MISSSYIISESSSQYHWKGSAPLSIKSFDQEVFYKVDGRSYRLLPRNILIVKPSSHYELTIDNGKRTHGFHLFFDGFSEIEMKKVSQFSDFWDYRSLEFIETTIPRCAKVNEMLNHGRLHYKTTWVDNIEKETYMSTMYQWLVKQSFESLKQGEKLDFRKSSTRHECLRRLLYAKDYIHGYFSDKNLKIQDVAHIACMSVNRLIQYFSALFGVSPLQLIIELRMEEARRLLREDEYAIYEIVDRVGYTSLSTFSSKFKRKYGFSPTDYRKEVKMKK